MVTKGNDPLLRTLDLPVFNNIEEFSSLIHIDGAIIKKISYKPYKSYKKHHIQKPSGGIRQILEPTKDLKAIQAWILRNILDKLKPSIYATAYLKGKNISYNVMPHSNNRYFICLDIQDFFPSISSNRIKKLFMLIGYSNNAANLLTKLCSLKYYGLPQGAVTSPAISNLIAFKMDRRIAGYTSKRNIIFTRYSDDIVISSNNPAHLFQALPRIKNIINTEHFKLNDNKFRVLGPKIKCSITGLIKNSSKPEFGIGRKKKHYMRNIMNRHVKNLPNDSEYKSTASIEGWLKYLKSVDINSYGQMKKYWDKLNNPFYRQTPI